MKVRTDNMALPAARLFVRVRAPYVLVPRGGKRIAARIARDFVTLIEGFTERFNELYGTSLTVPQGLAKLLDSNLEPSSLFSEYRVIAEQSRGVLTSWTVERGFDQGWKWLTPEFADWFVSTILPRPYKIDDFHSFSGAPLLTKILVEHPRGSIWMQGFVEELRTFLYPATASSAGAKN